MWFSQNEQSTQVIDYRSFPGSDTQVNYSKGYKRNPWTHTEMGSQDFILSWNLVTLPTPAQSLLQGIEATREIMDQLWVYNPPQEMRLSM